MRRKSTELNIFSMSALDLFASALGAFILIVLILLPYYKKENSTVPPVSKICPEPAPACPVCPTPRPVEKCPPIPEPSVKFADNLLVVEMSWYEKGDVDLYVTTPDGKYHWDNEYISGKPGRFTVDHLHGRKDGKPAIEVWKAFKPSQGVYKVCFNYLRKGDGIISVGGRLDKPTGPVIIRARKLSTGQTVCPLKFKISADYTYTQVSLN